MKFTGTTPIDEMNGYYVKREDLAYWSSLEYPSGSKVRQYMAMASGGVAGFPVMPPSPPCIVGCSANSAMQIYVAATAKQLNVKGIIYTASRKQRTEATTYAARMGAEVKEIKPGYLSMIRKRARDRAKELGQVVQWDPKAAIQDTIRQCENIPRGVKRIIVPTGSGLTALGILSGLIPLDLFMPVIVVATSTMCKDLDILKKSMRMTGLLPIYQFIEPTSDYDEPVVARLPDGTPLDPFYAAKAFKYLQPGDLLWPPGLRPVCSMPKVCQEAFKDWKGPCV